MMKVCAPFNTASLNCHHGVYPSVSQLVCRDTDTQVCRDEIGSVSRKTSVSQVCPEKMVCRDN